jgi:hypothetical protein
MIKSRRMMWNENVEIMGEKMCVYIYMYIQNVGEKGRRREVTTKTSM